MRPVPVPEVGFVDATVLHQVGYTFSTCHTLADLMRWALSQSPTVRITEIVTQDEYTHDVVPPFRDAYLSFDTT